MKVIASPLFQKKFKVKKQQLLLSCKVSKEALFLIAVGSHENYYKDLKNYLK